MASAMARAGHAVTLLGKLGKERTDLDLHAFYGVEPRFEVVTLPRPGWRGGGVAYAAVLGAELLRRRTQPDLVFSRDLVGALAAVSIRMPTVLEAHGVPAGRVQRAIWRRVMASRHLRRLVVISEALRRDLAPMIPAGVDVVVAHDGADLTPLGAPAPRARKRIGYAGNLYPGRGVDIVLGVARALPDCDVDLYGGSDADLARWRASGVPANATFHGFVPPARVGDELRRLDVLLMPYARTGVGVASGSSDTSRWCSPMKMFEYMASGVPLVSSDLPVLQEVLHDGANALIAPADDVAAWAAAVRRILDEPGLGARLAASARRDLEAHYTWDARVSRVLADL